MSVKSYFECADGTIVNFDTVALISKPHPYPSNLDSYVFLQHKPGHGFMAHGFTKETSSLNIKEFDFFPLVIAFKEYKKYKDSCKACEERNNRLNNML